MAHKAVFGIANDRAQTERIVANLQQAGFSTGDISVLFPDEKQTQQFVYEKHTKAPEGAIAGVSAGGAIGGTLGLLAGLGALAIPGIGPLVAAGPILAALSGAAAGAAVGGIAGALVGLGIPEIEAKRYENRMKKGHILVSVHTESLREVGRAEDLFKDAGLEDIWVTPETPVATTTPVTPVPAEPQLATGTDGPYYPNYPNYGYVEPKVTRSRR